MQSIGYFRVISRCDHCKPCGETIASHKMPVELDRTNYDRWCDVFDYDVADAYAAEVLEACGIVNKDCNVCHGPRYRIICDDVTDETGYISRIWPPEND